MERNNDNNFSGSISFFPDGRPVPELMTMEEVVEFLRIPIISKAKDHKNAIDNLKRFRDLPRICISRRNLYPREAILEWIRMETDGFRP
ncbi:MAG: hypothetical protein ACYSSP_10640 [Planctomycetota bacterium]|jgi:hypothetical protein